MMKRGGGVDGGSGGKKSMYKSCKSQGEGVGGGVVTGTSRKLKNISAFSSPYGLM